MKLHLAICTLVLVAVLASPAYADFPITTNANLDIQPQVAYNSTNQEYLVVWGEYIPFGGAFIPGRILGQRVAEDGTLLGSTFQIFSNGSYSRVAYNSALNEYLVITAPGTGILGQRVSNAGALIGSGIGLMTDQSYGRLLYNELSADYLLVAGQLVETPAGSGYWNLKIYSRRLSATGQPMGSPLFVDEIADGYGGPEPAFAVAYAPIQSSETPNGRYLMVTGRGIMVTLLNSEGAPIQAVYDPYHAGTTYRYVPFRTGSGVGGEFNVDVAFGTESGFGVTGPAFFVVWADQNNRWQSQQWSGIYGGFIDANKIAYTTDEVIPDNSFPISAIADHWAYDNYVESWRPRVAYNAPAGKYMVTWRETPGTSSYNDTKVNHIRADKEFEAITMNPNDVLSATTGNENPEEPAVASSTISGKGLVAWVDYRNNAATKQDIYASVYTIADVPPPPPPPPPTTTWVVTNTSDAGTGSLRQAILNANARIGMDTIAFNIPGSGVHTIQPSSGLPAISDPVLIDGYTQPGSSVNTNVFVDGLNTVLTVELNGANAGSMVNGLHITAGSSTVRGLIVNRFDSCGIKIDGPGANRIQGNYIGMDATGMAPLNNQLFGIDITDSPGNVLGGSVPAEQNLITGNGHVQGSTVFGAAIRNTGDLSGGTTIQGNLIGVTATGRAKLDVPLNGLWIIGNSNAIGGTEPGAGNVISGNTVGVFLWKDGNVVQGNRIGTDITGTVALGNRRGIQVAGVNNLIGGLTAAARNLISGNTSEGIFIGTSGEAGNAIEGNFIGTQADGASPLGNGSQGLSVYGAQNCATIGGTVEGAGNTIAFNGREGIRAPLNFGGIRILGNSIFGNTRLGIDLVGGTEDANGVTANDPGDGDTGPNNLQNYPALTAVEGGDFLSIDGTLNSTPSTTFRLEFFSTPSSETGGSRQGKTYLTSTEVVTDGSGNGGFSFTYGFPMGSGNVITATATDPNGNTSEFSDPVLIQYTSADLSVTNTNDDGAGSLRQAILAANALSGSSTISFNIPGSGVHTIRPASPLPTITRPVIIDGYTQPGSSVNTNSFPDGTNAVLKVEINGGVVLPHESCFRIEGGGTIVRGLVINDFTNGSGIQFNVKGGNKVQGCFIGTDVAGSAVRSNFRGVFIGDIGYNTIGGIQAAERNLISGNETGVVIAGSSAVGNVVQGNYLGLTAAGNSRLGNFAAGVSIQNGSSNTVGGTIPGSGNVIAGCGYIDNLPGKGIVVDGSGTQNTVAGNLVGTNAAGTDSVLNYEIGVMINGNGNFIGGTTAAARNVISGSRLWGLSLAGDSNFVQGNYIGTDITGSKPLGNLFSGVHVSGSHNLVGGQTPSAANVISGNVQTGIELRGSKTEDCRGNKIQGNKIGTQSDGSTPLGNVGPGVLISSWSRGNAIGDTVDASGNIIAFNGEEGVRVAAFVDPFEATPDPVENRIHRNSIFGNVGLGINLVGGIENSHGVTGNDPGDTDAGPNDQQNSPTITSAFGGSSLQVQANLNGSANTRFIVEFFASPAEGASHHYEGQTYLGSIAANTDGRGDAMVGGTINVPVGEGRLITATATDPDGNTSEFSAPFVTVTGVDPEAETLPLATALLQNYPNPFNPKTVVSSQLSVVSDVKIAVFDLLGRQIATLVNERRGPGRYQDNFDASGLASGVYIYRMTAGSFISVRTMLLVK